MTTSISRASAGAPPTTNVLRFGLGCFHFAYARGVPYTLRSIEFLQELKATLEKVPTLNRLVVDADESDEYEVEAGPLASLTNGSGLTPYPDLLDVYFDLYIPSRIQAEVAGDATSLVVGTERFRVFVNYTFHMPVAFVQLLDPPAHASPSIAVRIVREYLTREIAKLGTNFRFEFLGPTPFHANCSLEPQAGMHSADGRSLRVEHARHAGYDDIRAYYDPAIFGSVDEAFSILQSEMSDELGLYYEIRRTQLQSLTEWAELQDTATDLVQENPRRSRLTRTKDWLLRGRRLHELVTSLVTFEANRIFQRQSLDKHVRHTYDRDANPFLKPFIDNALSDAWTYPTEQLSRVASYLTERRAKAVELLVVLLAAIVGGIAGGAITLLLS